MLWAAHPVVHGLIMDGTFTGVGGVLVFLPAIITLFFCLSAPENTAAWRRQPLLWTGLWGLVMLGCACRCCSPAFRRH